MKKIFVSIISVLLISACTGFLNVRPQGYVLPETDEEFASIMHTILRSIEGGEDEFIVGNLEKLIRVEGCADNLDANVRIGNNLPSYAGELINSMQYQYSNYWPVVKDCNIVIENIKGRESQLAKSCISSAYAVKALLYYNMIRDYCEPWKAGEETLQFGLPIVEKFDINARPVRSSLKSTAEYTIGLMDLALSYKPKDELFIFTEWIIKAYKAKMLFWMEDWDNCSTLCKDILDNSGYSLTSIEEYDAMINSEYELKGEVMIRSHINNSSELDWYFSMSKKYLSSRPASAKLVKLYGEDPSKDVRYTSSLDKKRMSIKVAECKVRLSEIQLMYAECEYHKGNKDVALDAVNELRANRISGVVPMEEDNIPEVRTDNLIRVDAMGNEITPLLQLIFDERQKEFFIEGDRWYELKRNGCPEWWVISNGLKYTTKEYLYTAPIYRNDVMNNPEIKQNPGYEN